MEERLKFFVMSGFLFFVFITFLVPEGSAAEAEQFVKVTQTAEIIILGDDDAEVGRETVQSGTVLQVLGLTETEFNVEWNGQKARMLKQYAVPATEWEYYNDVTTFKTKVDAAVLKMENGRLVKRARLLKGQVFKKIGDYGDYHIIQFSSSKGYVLKADTMPAPGAKLPNGVVKGSKFVNRLITLNVVDFYYSSNGKLVSMGRAEGKVEVQAMEAYRDYYVVQIAGRRAYVKKNDVNRYTGDFVNPRKTYTYEQMIKDLKDIRLWYSDFTELQVIGKSVDGRNLYALKLGKGKEEIFINSSHHAREHLTTNLTMEMIDAYAYAYLRNKTIDGYNVRQVLNETSIWFVPMVNPDGVTLVQRGHKSAKNPDYVLKLNGYKTDFSAWKANIRGVDLNRQYPADWATICCNPGKPGPQNYKGKKPLTEPEARGIYDFTLAHSFKASAAYHSSGEILYWYFKQGYSAKKRDEALAKKIAAKTGYKLVTPVKNPSGGGYTDWFIESQKKPGFTPEISRAVGPRPVPVSSFDSIWKKNYSIGLLLAKETD